MKKVTEDETVARQKSSLTVEGTKSLKDNWQHCISVFQRLLGIENKTSIYRIIEIDGKISMFWVIPKLHFQFVELGT